jgi:Xaa-Pro aminopeptidase
MMFEFNSAEIAEKMRRVKALFDTCGVEGIYLKKSSNFAWITAGAYNIVGLGTEIGIAGILLTKGRNYVICNNIESARMKDEERLVEQGYEILDFPWFEDREKEIVSSCAGGKIASDHGFPGSVDIGPHLNPLRYSLTAWEIERYTKQALDTSRATEETALGIRPGETEQAVVGRLSEKLWAQGMDFIVAFCAADDRISRFRHPVATDRKIEKRAMISVNSRKRGLIVSITRFVQFEKLSDEMKKLYEDNVYVDSAMMAATLPGKPANEVFHEAVRAYAEKGYPEEYRLHHQGGSIGYFGRDYKATANTRDIIQENQAFTWNPSITGMKSEDTMLATCKGPIVLSEPVLFPALVMEKSGFTFRRPAIMEL